MGWDGGVPSAPPRVSRRMSGETPTTAPPLPLTVGKSQSSAVGTGPHLSQTCQPITLGEVQKGKKHALLLGIKEVPGQVGVRG